MKKRTITIGLSTLVMVLVTGAATLAYNHYASFTGQWKTTYGTMTMRDGGGHITGQYNNGGTIGDVEGDVSGNTMNGTWSDKTGNGPIKLTLSADGNSFKGSWGRSDGKGNAGGQWNGSRQ